MALVNEFDIGRNLGVIARTEATFGAIPGAAFWANTDSMKILNYKFEPKFERRDRLDTRATRSMLEQIEGVIDCDWNAEMWLLPRGGTTPPDADPFFLAGMGVGGASGGDYDYTFSGSQNLPMSFAMWCASASLPGCAEGILGAVVQEMKIAGATGEEPKATFSGQARQHIFAGRTTLNGALAGGEATITVQAGATYQYDVGSIIQVGSSTGPHYITSINHGTAQIGVTPNIVGAQSNGSVVRPVTPYSEAQTGGSPISEIRGLLSTTTAGITVPFGIESFEITVSNNYSMVRPMFTQYAGDFIPGNRMVKGSMRFWAQGTDAIWLGRARQFNTTNINPIQLTIELGAVGNPGRLALEMPAVKFSPNGLEVPDAEEGKFTLEFVALGTGSGDNELVLSWD